MAAAHTLAAAIITGMPNVRLKTATIILLGGTLLMGSLLESSLIAGAFAAELRPDLTPADRTKVNAVTVPTNDFSKAEAFEAMTAGAATFTGPADAKAFTHPLATLSFEQQQQFSLGEALFQKFWVSSPSSTQASDGLGPLFNARSCESCHQRGGRGHPPGPDGDATSMFLRLARPAHTGEEKAAIATLKALNFGDDTYGRQLQDRAVPGLAAEGRLAVTYQPKTVTLAGGETVTLRVPTYTIDALGYGPMGADTTLSPRIANPMIGMGLIEAIADEDILANAERQTQEGNGISGTVARVRDHLSGDIKIGRFGWKAENATVRDQAASALAGDIGISSPDDPRHAGDCTVNQPQCLTMPNGVQARLGPVEAPPPVLDLMTFYSETLAPPKRRDVTKPEVLAGKALFYASGCASCHQPKYVTRRNAAYPALSFQLIWPYSDFLLHDMGPDLADGQQVGLASGQQWRTPPLWGLGLTAKVGGRQAYLHDGRATSLPEAILWHDGEAEKARNAFASMTPGDRKALITFLESL
ncbi:c-type cytochrome [Agrobacterium vitis]|uniref:C-type cytochrome n=2 Tax=Agrobacterium vitis TaxID=373 RepID=A0A368NX21_AGRVI|nr:thiol oxidoreductase [Agrobacterium vitis]KAA3528278.1 thiol oxidoreductase [Agrobacterium vitis]MCF1477781.1 c-type cytochrome [Agrobacterium vitis]MUZ97886.1 c-type cytochrome [Agrobacterium vitis]MVA30617.1 c-type cytochrome [Agrobacterium vitis]